MGANLKVELIAYTPEAEKIVASAAKLCYSRVGISEIGENLDKENIEKFLNMLLDLGHESPVEHVSFTFAIEGVSRSLTHQLVRHRIASYSQQSQRYVKLDQFEYIVPPSIEEDERARELFIKAMEEDQRVYNELVDILSKKHYEKLISEGKNEKEAKRLSEKMAIEDARYVFPNACETKIVVTMNARSLLNFFRHRCCNRAQWEIHNLADEMLKKVREVAPTIFKFAGPSCVYDKCHEGSMSCGKMMEVRERYLNL
ncbi:FAD-dependent thymidylate synthase [Caloramator australicus]|uniref:Flavin-dependent thymidylate synthase n=1 Tax=Caloramator australicus RC3 TaxID=857293 RepID=I7KWI5_9CLOT|nr:FAD-dependent thymidylate synthase [Caloramator australicus]CCJ34536.1 Thymidylate synthase thyX [Caloramator australicus RC3]